MKERYLAGAGTGAQLQPEEEAEFGGATLTQNFYFGPEDADNNEAPPVAAAASRSRSKQAPEHHRQPQLPKQPQHSEHQQGARKSPQKPTRKSSPSAAKSTREMGSRSKSDLEKMFPKTVAPSRVGPSKSSPTKPAAFTPSKKISASPTRRKTPEKRTTSVSPKRPVAGKTSTTAAAAMKGSLSPNRKLKKVDGVHKSRHSVSALSDLRKFVEGKEPFFTELSCCLNLSTSVLLTWFNQLSGGSAGFRCSLLQFL